MLAGVSTERSGMSTIICIEEIKPQSFVIINPKITLVSMLFLLKASIPFYSMMANESAYFEAFD